MLKRNKIYEGHTLSVLKSFLDELFDMSMSSPPYWGLRDYGIPIQIWDETGGCIHEFELSKPNIVKSHNGEGATTLNKGFKDTKQEVINKSTKKPHEMGFCSKCGAWKGSLGLEPNFELFIKHLCDIYDEVKRVLKPYGTVWVNLGDSYGSGKGETGSKNCVIRGGLDNKSPVKGFQKSLLMVPQRFAIEMINRGWILRNVIIWHKNNCMPSSASDRFTVDFEYVFFFSKRKQYYFEQQFTKLKAVNRIKASNNLDMRKDNHIKKAISNKAQKAYYEKMKQKLANGEVLTKNMRTVWNLESSELRKKKYYFEQQFDAISESESTVNRRKYAMTQPDANFKNDGNQLGVPPSKKFTGHYVSQKNKRTVWNINTQATPEAHFATFPIALCETPILAGCPLYVCESCGKPREKVFEKSISKRTAENGMGNGELASGLRFGDGKVENKGYTKCSCNALFKPGIVLDPFMGSGTTAMAALKHGRNYVGIDLNPEYIKIAEKRIESFKQALERAEKYPNKDLKKAQSEIKKKAKDIEKIKKENESISKWL